MVWGGFLVARTDGNGEGTRDRPKPTEAGAVAATGASGTAVRPGSAQDVSPRAAISATAIAPNADRRIVVRKLLLEGSYGAHRRWGGRT
ncbi:hypothetical protein Ais01nite_14290 [Asanoa ishikariensis]|nr:hypothetical protein Ais01nite_14290 [Asanoa ishikariensis]